MVKSGISPPPWTQTQPHDCMQPVNTSQLWHFWAEAWRLSLPWHWQRPKSLGRSLIMSRAPRKPHWAGEQKFHLSSAKPLRNWDRPWPHPRLILPAALWATGPPCTVLLLSLHCLVLLVTTSLSVTFGKCTHTTELNYLSLWTTYLVHITPLKIYTPLHLQGREEGKREERMVGDKKRERHIC